MTLSLENLSSLKAEADRVLKSSPSSDELEGLKRDWLGKDGRIKSLFQELRSVDPDQKAVFAQSLNELRDSLGHFFDECTNRLVDAEKRAKLSSEYYDLSLPGINPGYGCVHPLTRCEEMLLKVARQYGFESCSGPEIETDFFCFDALNVPQHHPARDLQDTFYTDLGHPLRTHLTAVSARAAARGPAPIKVVSLGRAYRNEAEDATHTAMFHQFDLVWIDEGLTLAHLMGLIQDFLKELYGKRRKVRFVRKFYPYTEPSIGPQIDCIKCNSKGCAACGHVGWVTVAGAGILHKNVMSLFHHDPEKVVGLAFGMGTSRLASQFLGFPDIRIPYENDLRVTNNIR